MVYVRTIPNNKSWWYVSVNGWQPFAYFGAGGWICLDPRWVVNKWRDEFARRRRVKRAVS